MTVEYDDDDPLAHRSRAADLERIKQARKKRVTQLRNWHQYDRMMEKNKHKLLAAKGKNGKRRIHFESSVVLLEAAAREDIDEVRKILNEGGSPNVCNDDGLTALHQACIDNSLLMCQLLIQYKAEVNSTDSELWTPLHASAACAHIDICACLIDNGADLLALNAEGNMPYDICEEENTLDLIENAMAVRGITQEQIDEMRKVPELKMLKEIKEYAASGGNLLNQDEQGATMLHIAASCGYLDVGRFLLDKNVPIACLDKDGWQAIHVAACWGQVEFIEFLLIRGANIDACTKSGETVYEICEDVEMNRRLQQIKEEIDRRMEIKKSLEIKPNLTAIGRRSNSSKRSASIRRSSMREKSLMSWKEARQEALIREKMQEKMVPTNNSSQINKNPGNLTVNNNFPVSTSNGDGEQLKASIKSDKGAIYEYKEPGSVSPNLSTLDIDQVKLEAQIATEEELTKKGVVQGGLIRRGSSRNSFTHKHPYHSPVRDPSLLLTGPEETIEEETTDNLTPIPKPRKNIPVADTRGSVHPDPVFIRNCDPNASVIYKNHTNNNNNTNNSNIPPPKPAYPQSANDNTSSQMPNNAPMPPLTVKRRKNQKIENKQNVNIQKHKVQGCCEIM